MLGEGEGGGGEEGVDSSCAVYIDCKPSSVAK